MSDKKQYKASAIWAGKGNLVITRREAQSIIINIDGEEIEVHVSKIGTHTVALAICADKRHVILRKELLTKKISS